MKKSIYGLLVLSSLLIGGCTINYDSYYEKYGDVSNRDGTLNSEKIEDNVTSYPEDNSDLIDKYGDIFEGLVDDYEVYASYYSSKYDVIYISYDNKVEKVQTIDSKDLALIEEHLLNYFDIGDDYSKYLKVVRVYPDYVSSVCHVVGASEEEYSKIEGCANYNQLEASVNLNGLVNINRFFNPLTYTEEGYTHYIEPKRDTFAHEFGHVSTYYNLILKGDSDYETYLKLRLKDAYDMIYPSGLPATYDSNMTYNIQPVEILADDYVELYYDTSKKAGNDYYDYTLVYRDLRNSLSDTGVDVVTYLKDDQDLYDEVKAYYDSFLNNKRKAIEPIVVKVNGDIYSDIKDIKKGKRVGLKHLDDANLVAMEEVIINNEEYYRIVLANAIKEENVRSDYSFNIGYVLKSECEVLDLEVLYFDRYNSEVMSVNSSLPINEKGVRLLPYYDFSYFINDDAQVTIYSYLDDGFESFKISESYFK